MEIMQRDNKIYQLQLFAGVEHGFALRGNMDVPYERKGPCPLSSLYEPCDLTWLCLGYVKEQSLKGIVEWFDFWLSR
jgi:hypothetical protein